MKICPECNERGVNNFCSYCGIGKDVFKLIKGNEIRAFFFFKEPVKYCCLMLSVFVRFLDSNVPNVFLKEIFHEEH